MKQFNILTLLFLGNVLFFSCTKVIDSSIPNFNDEEYYAGGNTTVFSASSDAFSSPANNLAGENIEKHKNGDAHFEQKFVTSPSLTNFGLGPIYNDISCQGCHILDGRGDKPSVVRISIPGINEHGGPLSVPGFGGQLQDKAVFEQQAEGIVKITYEEVVHFFADGTSYSLRKPTYTLQNTYIEAPTNILLSLRTAPPIFGLGLLESIEESSILNYADIEDNNNDGISGKPNYVWNAITNTMQLGRFGWKAGQANLYQQTAAAFNEDMGITNVLFNIESSFGQSQYDNINDDAEIDFNFLDATAFYTKTLGVPSPRNLENPEVQKGKNLFYQIGCNNCHIGRWQTALVAEIPELSNQIIYPYTDLLLHDMGADLADNRPDFDALGNEWKTRPLWGIGLTEVANGHTNFLHDARARNIEEAILWHGGEAEKSKNAYTNLTLQERKALLRFLNAL